MHQHHVHLPMYWGDAQSVATKNKQLRSIFVLVPVLLSLDTFPYVSAANLVLLKLYSLVPQNTKISSLQMCILRLSLLSLFDQRRCWIANLY